MRDYLNIFLINFLNFQTVEEWRIVFFISAGVYAIGVVFCAFFVSGEIQPWACQKPAAKNSDLESKNNMKILT
jgi:ACS family sodium-dependent inorganic phosphate cotransporter